MKIEICAAKLCILLLVGVSLSTNLSGQTSIELTVKRAESAFDEGQMALAHEQYATLLSIDASNSVWHARFGAACTHDPASFDLARTHLLQADKLGIQETDYAIEWSFYMGKSMHLGYEFDQAVTWFTSFLEQAKKKDPKRKEAEMRLRQCQAHSMGLQGMQQVHVLEKFEANRDLFFRFYELTANAGRLVAIPAELKTKIDRKNDHQGQMQILPNVPFVLYSSFGETGESGLDLYRAEIMPNGGFGIPEKLPSPINSIYDDTTPTWSPPRSGQPSRLHFASNRPASLGGFDLFQCPFDLTGPATEWKFLDVKPMVYTINTTSNEWFYLPAGDGKRIWFASDREGDFEALQVYQIREHTTALAPVELSLTIPQELAKTALDQSARLQLVNETDDLILLSNLLAAGSYNLDATILLPLEESKSLRWEWVNAEGNAIDGMSSTEVFSVNGLKQGQSIFQEMDWNGHLNQSIQERMDVSAWSPELLRNQSMISVTDALAIENNEVESEVNLIPDAFANAEFKKVFRDETGKSLADQTGRGKEKMKQVEGKGLETGSLETQSQETADEEAASPDVASQETIDAEVIGTETVSTETVNTETVNTETVNKETVSQETASAETVGTEKVSTEKVSTEKVSRETVSTETVSTETVSQETVSQETVNQETVNQETASSETVDTETDSTEAASSETANAKTVGTETVDTESDNTETASAEMANAKTVGTETGSTETGSTETGSTETGSTEIVSKETVGTEKTSEEKTSEETASSETVSSEKSSEETANANTASARTEKLERETEKTQRLLTGGVTSESVEIKVANDAPAKLEDHKLRSVESDGSSTEDTNPIKVRNKRTNEAEEEHVEIEPIKINQADSERPEIEQTQNQYAETNRTKKRRIESRNAQTENKEPTGMEPEQAVLAKNAKTDRRESDRATTNRTEEENTTPQNGETSQARIEKEKTNDPDREEHDEGKVMGLNSETDRSKANGVETKKSFLGPAEHEDGNPEKIESIHELLAIDDTSLARTTESKIKAAESDLSNSSDNKSRASENAKLKTKSNDKDEFNVPRTLDSNISNGEPSSNPNESIEASEKAKIQHDRNAEAIHLAATNPNHSGEQDHADAQNKIEFNNRNASNGGEGHQDGMDDDFDETKLESDSFQEKPERWWKRRKHKNGREEIPVNNQLHELALNNKVHGKREDPIRDEGILTSGNSLDGVQTFEVEMEEIALPDSPPHFKNQGPDAEILTENAMDSRAQLVPNEDHSSLSRDLDTDVAYAASNSTTVSKSETLESWLGNTSEAARAFIAQTFILDAATVTTGAPIEEVASKAIFPSDDVAYSVQVGAFKNRPEARYFGSFSPVIAVPLASGIARYLTGIFETYELAENARDAIRELGGFEDAFVVVYENGERIPLSKVRPPSSSPMTGIMENANDLQNAIRKSEPLPIEMMTGGQDWSEIEGVWFSIQIGAFRGFPSPELIENLCPCNRELLDGALTRWTTGQFQSLEKALQSLEVIRNAFVEDAFIVAFANGKRVKIANAVERQNAVSLNSVQEASYRIRVAQFQNQVPVAIAAKLLRLSEAVPMRAWPVGGQTTYISLPYREKHIAELALQRCLDAGFDAKLERISSDN